MTKKILFPNIRSIVGTLQKYITGNERFESNKMRVTKLEE